MCFIRPPDARRSHREKPHWLTARQQAGDNRKAHGEAFGVKEEIRGAKRALWMRSMRKFLIPRGCVSTFTSGMGKRDVTEQTAWEATFKQYEKVITALATKITACSTPAPGKGWDKKNLPVFLRPQRHGGRDASAKVSKLIRAKRSLVARRGSRSRITKNRSPSMAPGDFEAGKVTRTQIHFGIREPTRCAPIMKKAIVSKVRQFGGGLRIFTASVSVRLLRLAAIMEYQYLLFFHPDHRAG